MPAFFLMKHYSDLGFLNVGTGEDVTIADFASEVARVVGYKGKIEFDTSRPDGPPRKLLDVSKIKKLGWSPKIRLHDGLAIAYADFLAGGGRSTG
jgi:GDP-L-fucose synthase